MCELLSAHVDPIYNAEMPTEQFGATSGRGTDFASHIVRSFLEYCLLASLSYFILFVDLVKAFDRIVRELVLGIPAGVQDPRQFLANLGVEPDQIEWILAFISKHGCLFERWGVDPKVLALIKNLHASS